MRFVIYFYIYALALFNVYIWMIWPEVLYAVLKWDIFFTILVAPLIYFLHKDMKDERTHCTTSRKGSTRKCIT